MEATGRHLEIEITPAMLSAGIEAACLFNPSEDDLEVMIPAIYCAMFAQAPMTLASSPSLDRR